MANKIGGSRASIGLLTDIDTVARNAVGTIREADDGSQHIYLIGVASTVAGDHVTFNHNGATARLVPDAVGPVAVANAATVASTWGWYCIVSPLAGAPVNAAATVVANLPGYIDGTTALVDDDVAVGDLIHNYFIRSTTTSGQCTAQFRFPYVTNESN